MNSDEVGRLFLLRDEDLLIYLDDEFRKCDFEVLGQVAYWAIRVERPSIARAVLLKFPELSQYCTNNHEGLLHELSNKPDYLDIAELLVGMGVNVNEKTICGLTPLMYAASHNNTPLMHLLLRNGARINELDNDGETALSWAIGSRCIEAVKCLIDCGADVEWNRYENRIGTFKGIPPYSLSEAEQVKCLLSKASARVKRSDEHLE